MKILEITAFSSGICGLWSRVNKEAQLLKEKGHEVFVFSSNIKRGLGKIEYAPDYEIKNGVKIKRFKPYCGFGENTFFWSYSTEALKLKPDLIISHAYRQYYSTIALKVARRLNIPCILVTHAPFLDKNLRDFKLNLAVLIYDNFIGKRILNKYSKIFTITNWEIPYLLNLGVKRDKIVYSPNGIPKEFFRANKIKNKKTKFKNILFLGRIAPIKDVETLLNSFKLALKKENNLILNLVGPVEEGYGKKIKLLIKKLNIKDKVIFHKPVYDLQDKISIIDNSDIFILSSKREGMPQSLIEAMSRGKVVISSKTDGGKEIVKDGENGYLFDIGDEVQLSKNILESIKENKKNESIKKNARKTVEQFSWDKLINKIDGIIQNQKISYNNPYKISS